MRSKLPILAGLALAAALALAPGLWIELGRVLTASLGGRQPAAGPAVRRADGRGAGASRSADGQQLIAQAARAVFAYESLSAQIRLRVRLFQQNLVGKGKYFQLGPRDDKLLRLNLRIRTAQSEACLQQVCDGRNLWVYQDLPAIDRPLQRQATVTRVDLRRVHDVVQQQGGAPANSLTADWLIRGGLANLLKELDAHFDFYQTDAAQLSGVPVWVVRGRWKPARLMRVAQQKDATIAQQQPIPWANLPAHLPQEAVVWLGQNDLFPFRIQYRRWDSGAGPTDPGASSDATANSIVTMELFEVATDDIIDPRLFQFQPPTELEVKDRTDEYLARLGVRPPA